MMSAGLLLMLGNMPSIWAAAQNVFRSCACWQSNAMPCTCSMPLTQRRCTCCLQAVPLLAMLDDLVPRMGAGQAGALRKVVFVWLSQTGDEFSIMDPSLLELARQELLHS